MILDVFRYTCGNCGTRFDAPNLVGGYGCMLARSSGRGSMALVDALHDQVFTDVEDVTAEVVDRSQVSDRRFGDAVRYAFSVSCDPDSDGSPFYIGEHPHCPSCGSNRMVSWERTGELVELDIPQVTHESWSGKDEGQRRRVVREAVNDFLSG